jgi:hypothetical protein
VFYEGESSFERGTMPEISRLTEFHAEHNENCRHGEGEFVYFSETGGLDMIQALSIHIPGANRIGIGYVCVQHHVDQTLRCVADQFYIYPCVILGHYDEIWIFNARGLFYLH